MECDKASNLGFSPGRILDRKIEAKGLAQSFSANISRKGTPKKSDSGRRVKDLVDRLEKARGSTPSDVDRKGSNRPNNASRPDEVDSKLGESSNDVADEVGEVTIGVVEYSADSSSCSHDVVTLHTSDELGEVRRLIASGNPEHQHQGFPVIDESGCVKGVLTRRQLLDPSEPDMRRIRDLALREPVVVHEHHSLRQAADHMVSENIGRVIVVGVDAPHSLIGILTRGDLLAAHGQRLKEAHLAGRHIRIGG